MHVPVTVESVNDENSRRLLRQSFASTLPPEHHSGSLDQIMCSYHTSFAKVFPAVCSNVCVFTARAAIGPPLHFYYT